MTTMTMEEALARTKRLREDRLYQYLDRCARENVGNAFMASLTNFEHAGFDRGDALSTLVSNLTDLAAEISVECTTATAEELGQAFADMITRKRQRKELAESETTGVQ